MNEERTSYKSLSRKHPGHMEGVTYAVLAIGETLKEISEKLDPLVEQATFTQRMYGPAIGNYDDVRGYTKIPDENPVRAYFNPKPDLLEQLQDERDAMRMLLDEIRDMAESIAEYATDGHGERAYRGLNGMVKRIDEAREAL